MTVFIWTQILPTIGLISRFYTPALAVWLYDRESKEFSLKENGGISNEYRG
ncbi:hypothetical protein [Lysinibacillus contaminans]|uniref:hypothetical protein n=1 Tax=Lysinibacillus contaminans TaxID=1293441 RepID=UPI000AE5EB2F|nr:hypothetical protein [Lysinibacillus contaminans]